MEQEDTEHVTDMIATFRKLTISAHLLNYFDFFVLGFEDYNVVVLVWYNLEH